MDDSNKKAIILMGHGSRVPDAGKHMEKVASGLRAKYGYNIVEICYMSRLGPHFPEIFEKCVVQGVAEIVVIPYFLHDGLHLVLDIPEMMQEIVTQHPEVKLVLGKNLGFDDSLVDLVEREYRLHEIFVMCGSWPCLQDGNTPCLPVNMSSFP